jgi:hypothetical protein
MARARQGLSTDQLRALAQEGAASRITQLRAEIAALEQAFPELKAARPARSGGAAAKEPKRKAPKMSQAARKAVSVRMKKYWAERRKTKGAGK